MKSFVRYAVAGDYFGESILLSNSSRRGATVEAMSDVTLFVVEKHDLWFVLGDDKGIDSPAIQRLFNLSKSRMSKAFTTISKNMMLSEMSQTQKNTTRNDFKRTRSTRENDIVEIRK